MTGSHGVAGAPDGDRVQDSGPATGGVAGPACGDGAVGGEPGDLAEDFGLRDQQSQTVLLSDYCGQVVLLELGAMWCPACQGAAEKIPQRMSEHGAEGFIVLNVMTENPQFETPSIEELARWAVTFDIETPVLVDIDWQIWARYFPRKQTPRSVLIGRNGRVLKNDFIITDDDIQSAL